jgi:SAM-dependent methyltransferase
MLGRGRALASEKGLVEQMAFVEGDFNKWRPRGSYDAVIANQSLHHVVKLEHLFDSIAAAIGAEGRFVTSDMIGRNGHQRWPEALAMVRELWRELPPAYRYNVQLRRQEDEFLDWDCSGDGFEGIRAQDILPLLIERFHFELFVAFANVIDPFIDRSFGPHFNRDAEWDRAFIDRAHAMDEQAMLEGRIKPTHMYAVLRARGGAWPSRSAPGLAPEDCVRRP